MEIFSLKNENPPVTNRSDGNEIEGDTVLTKKGDF